MPGMTCGNCRYFEDARQECRRDRPALEIVRWPTVTPDEWCGEYEGGKRLERQASDREEQDVSGKERLAAQIAENRALRRGDNPV